MGQGRLDVVLIDEVGDGVVSRVATHLGGDCGRKQGLGSEELEAWRKGVFDSRRQATRGHAQVSAGQALDAPVPRDAVQQVTIENRWAVSRDDLPAAAPGTQIPGIGRSARRRASRLGR